MADGLLNKASIILTPTGYKAGTLYNVAPVVEPYEDFDFARASVASRVNSSGLVEMVGRTLGSNLVQNGDFSELGSELVTNGDFPNLDNWSVNGGDYATIVDGALNSNNTENGNWYAENISQNISFVNGKTYKVTFKAKNISGGLNLRLTQGANIIFTQNITSTFVDYVVYYTANADNGSIRIFCNDAVGEFQIDNVSVKQVDPNDSWTLGSGWSIEDGKANVDTASNNRIEQDGIVSDGNTYAITFTILNYNSGSIRLRLGNTYGEYTSGNGTYTQYIQCTTNDKFRIYASSSGADLSIDNVSVKEVIDTNNIPRISYDSNGDNGHILLEPTSTNLFPYSEDFSTWNKVSNAVVIDNFTNSPDGTQNASKFTFDGTTNGRVEKSLTVTSGNQYTFSVWLKNDNLADTTQVWLAFSTFSQGEYVTVTNEWQRFTTTQTADGTTEYPRIQTSEIGSIFAWGAQFEELPYATSYIPTLTGSTETRATETANGAGSADLINSTEGVLYAEIAALDDDDLNNRRISLAKDGDNKVNLVLPTVSNTIQGIVITGGVVQFNKSFVISNTVFNKIAIKYKVNDFALWINGVEVATDTSGNTFSSGELNQLVFNNGNGNNPFYGKCKAVAVFNEALSDAELNNLTG